MISPSQIEKVAAAIVSELATVSDSELRFDRKLRGAFMAMCAYAKAGKLSRRELNRVAKWEKLFKAIQRATQRSRKK